MAVRFNSIFAIQANNAFQYPGLMEDFSAGGVSVSASIYKTIDNLSMVGSEATTAGVDIKNVSSKIGERGESFPVGS